MAGITLEQRPEINLGERTPRGEEIANLGRAFFAAYRGERGDAKITQLRGKVHTFIDSYQNNPNVEVPTSVVVLSKAEPNMKIPKDPREKVLVVIDEGVVPGEETAAYEFPPRRRRFLKKGFVKRPDVVVSSFSPNVKGEDGIGKRRSHQIKGADNLFLDTSITLFPDSSLEFVSLECAGKLVLSPHAVVRVDPACREDQRVVIQHGGDLVGDRGKIGSHNVSIEQTVVKFPI